MMRYLGLAAVLALSATAVVAQSDPIAERKALMKANVDNFKNAMKIVRGEESFDGAKVQAAFVQWTETAHKLPNLFPEKSKTGGQTRALPKIWDDRSGFDAKVDAFAKAVADGRDKAKDVEGLKVAIAAVGKACDGCHDQYRRAR